MAARTEQRRFGTFALDSTNGITLSRWGNRAQRAVRLTPKIAAPGSNLREDRATGQRYDIAGRVRGVDTGEASTRLGALIQALEGGEQMLRFYDDREIAARLAGEVTWAPVPGSEATLYDFAATLVTRTPYWQGTTETTNQFIRSGVGPHAMNASNPSGDAPVFPRIKITNTGPTFSDKVLTIRNFGSSEQIQLIGLSMVNGDEITVDMEEGFIGTASGIPIHPFAVDGLFFSINAAAATGLRLTHNVGASAAWVVDVLFFPRFYTG